jgi:DNA invertase Pin-like site-specific DNA recombinase
MDNSKSIAMYLRISKDDGRYGESQSIENQRTLITDYINSHADLRECKALEFVDDGHTGTNFLRPGVTQMLNVAQKGEISCIIVKDFSRFGREYIDVGGYLEQIFPFLGIRFISVTDCYDSMVHGSLAGDISNGFKNLYNSYFSKNLSQKVRSGLIAKKESGTYIPSCCPYGYKKADSFLNNEMNAESKYILEIDEGPAEIVRRIFDLKLAGNSSMQITRILNTEIIPSPLAHKLAAGENRKGRAKSEKPQWTQQSVLTILNDIRYTGVFAYNMYRAVTIGQKKTRKLPMKEWKLIPGALPAIIDSDIYIQTRSKQAKSCLRIHAVTL